MMDAITFGVFCGLLGCGAIVAASQLRRALKARRKKKEPGIPTSKGGQRLASFEEETFRMGICPDCEQRLVEGPHGGMSINYGCLICGSLFNDMGPFGVDRITDACPELTDVLLEGLN